MKETLSILLLPLLFVLRAATAQPANSGSGGHAYDYTAYTECKTQPENALYDGGILKGYTDNVTTGLLDSDSSSPAFLLYNLTGPNIYAFSSWVRIRGADSSLVRVRLAYDGNSFNCIGNVIASSGCWSFLKGGFTLDSYSSQSILHFQNSDGADIEIEVASASLQPFTYDEWTTSQQMSIDTVRKRAATIHVSDENGNRLEGADITLQQVSKDFSFGAAISENILGNAPYQNWYLERFNTAVFEDELKWYFTEPKPGQVNYTIPDQMLEFVRAHQLMARGHNIFWENPDHNPSWVQNLTGLDLERAVMGRIHSLMSKYKGEFIHWDVSNEVLHYDFYEDRLGPNTTLRFFETAHLSDPLATLFMNEFNVVETCDDTNSSVDAYIAKMKGLQQGGVKMSGIGLEGHFITPSPPLIRATLDKLATLGLPIWLTEVDISNTLDKETQASYLDVVLREMFSHPSVDGIMLWTAIHPEGCYQMCLTDENFQNLPTGNVVDTLLKEWQTGIIQGQTDGYGSYSFYGFLGEYNIQVVYGETTASSTFSLSQSDETKHFNIQL